MIAETPSNPAALPEIPAPTGKPVSFLVPSFFISVAALLIALVSPIQVAFTSLPVETLAFSLIGILLVWVGALGRVRAVMYTGVGLLLALILVAVVTQPAVLSAPVAVIWPLRILIVVVVGVVWTLLMQPQDWIRRAALALLVPTLLVLLAWGGPGLGRMFFGWNLPLFVTNFAPIWLAVDSRGTLYATEGNGSLIWVFDESGSPVGGIRPARSPNPPTPGPGILPNGMEDEVIRSGAGGGPVMQGAAGGEPGEEGEGLQICGVAVDADDNLWTVSIVGVPPFNVLKFDGNGSILAKFPLDRNFYPSAGCLALDKDYIYLTSSKRELLVMDFAGNTVRTIPLPIIPVGIAALGDGKVIMMDVRSVMVVDANSTVMPEAVEISAAPEALFQAITVTADGDILLTDTANSKILKLDLATYSVISTIGSMGDSPGQFRGLGGITLDKNGRLYVADWSHRVIQRFAGNGAVDAIMWAAFNLEPNEAAARNALP